MVALRDSTETMQEEFINFNTHIIHSQKLFSSKLANYLIFYNYQKD